MVLSWNILFSPSMVNASFTGYSSLGLHPWSLSFCSTSIKENIKSNKFLTQIIQEIWDTMKRRNLRIIGVEDGKELQLKGSENMFNKIIEENFSNLKKDIPMKVQEAYRAPNRLDQKNLLTI